MEKVRRPYGKITLDAKSIAAQDEVLKRKEKRACMEEIELLKKRELMPAISTSQRSREEIMAFLRG